MEREFMFSIVPSYKEQFLRVYRSRLPGTCTLHKNNDSSFIFLINLLVNVIKLCGIMYVGNGNKQRAFIHCHNVQT